MKPPANCRGQWLNCDCNVGQAASLPTVWRTLADGFAPVGAAGRLAACPTLGRRHTVGRHL
jgi:hypothetical protein